MIFDFWLFKNAGLLYTSPIRLKSKREVSIVIIPDKLPTENARGYAYRVLRQNIVNLELEPGSVISENETASLMHLSRTPVREALIELSKNGLVEIQPQRGSYISKIDYAIIEEAKFVRLVLELAVLRIACVSIPKEYSIKINANLASQELCLEQEKGLELIYLDNEFHRLLFEAVRKQWSYNLLSSQMMHFDRLRVLAMKALDHARPVTDHHEICRAIENHDRDLAESLMSQHLSRHALEKEELMGRYPDYFK